MGIIQPRWLVIADRAANLFIGRLRGSFKSDYDDFRQAARIGAWQASLRWQDTPRGKDFDNWIYTRALYAALDLIRTRGYGKVGLSRRGQEFIRAAILGLVTDDDIPLWVLRSAAKHQSLDDHLPIDNLSQERLRRGDTIPAPPDEHTAEFAEQLRQETRDLLDEMLARFLPRREALVIALRYYDGYSLQAIADLLGVAESRASQIETRALQRLRQRGAQTILRRLGQAEAA